MSILNDSVPDIDPAGLTEYMCQTKFPFARDPKQDGYAPIVISAGDPINHPNVLKIYAVRVRRMLREKLSLLFNGSKSFVASHTRGAEQGNIPR